MRIKFSKYILTLAICIGLNSIIEGKHIIGGDVFFDCLSIDTINNRVIMHFEFQMYRDGRDDEGADYDGGPSSQNQGAEFGLFRRNSGSNSWTYITHTPPTVYNLRERVPANTQPCLIAPPAIFVERAVYEFDMEIDIVPGAEYMVAYQRCCRSESISNLITPGQFGAAFAIEFTAESLALCNDSPIYNEFPPLIVCAGFPLEYDHSARDAEGDQVIYEFCVPLSAGGNDSDLPRSNCGAVIPAPQFCGPDAFREVRFRSPQFTIEAPMGGRPLVGINANTGLISGTPIIIGEHVMAVCASEYRDGVLLSTIRRDFQFIVSSCEKAVEARIASDRTLGENEFEVILCGDLTVQFENQSVRDIDIQEYYWEIDVDGNLLTSAEKDPSFTLPDVGVYQAKMVLNPGIPNCTDSALVTVSVYPGLEADFQFEYDTCVAGPVAFEDLSFTDAQFIRERRWDFGEGSAGSQQVNPNYTYQIPGLRTVNLEIEDNNGCIDRAQKNVNYQPAPSTIIVEPSLFLGCEPAEVFFDNLTAPINDSYMIEWDFGDGTDGEDRFEVSPTHVYEEDGVYNVSIAITSPIGCEITRNFNGLIQVQKGPDANFTFNPESPTIFQNEVSFTNLTTGAIGFFWDFGDEGLSFEDNPTYEFRDTGMYLVTLQATSSNGCTDTTLQVIDVAPVADIFYPNAFTPDGNGRNDSFKGVGSTALLNDFKLIIYDRWGGEVFSTVDPTLGWNGRINNSGNNLPGGVYLYVAQYRVPRGEMKETRGYATLVR